MENPLKAISWRPTFGFWRSLFFYIMAFTTTGMLIWQLKLLEPPEKWCAEKRIDVCYAGLIRNLDIRDHAIMGLIVVLAVVVIGSMVVTYKLAVSAGGGADGFHVDVHQDKTTVTTPGGGSISVPTVPTAPTQIPAPAPGAGER